MGANHEPIPTTSSATSAAPPLRRVLRVGVLQDGRLVEERLLGEPGEILIGSDARCAIVLPPQPRVPRAAPLFALHKGHFFLQLPVGIDGQIAASPGAPPVALRGEPGPLQRHPLEDEARGRVQLGDVTVLFQLVRVAPLHRVALPPSLHDSLMRQLDWWMVGTAAASFAAHAVLMVMLRGYDPPRTPEMMQDLPERIGRFIHEMPRPPAPKPKPPEAVTTTGKGGVRGPRGGGPHTPAVTHTETPEEQQARIRAAVARLLTATGGGESAMRDVLRGGAEFPGADDVFAQANSVSLASRTGSLQVRGADRSATTVGIGGLRLPDVGDVKTGDRTDERTGGRTPRCPGGVCTPDPPAPPEDGCDPKVINAKLRSYRGALVACYSKTVTRNPGLAGKLHLNLTIAQSGRVTRAEVEPDTLDDEDLSSCIAASARHWIFPELTCSEMSISQLVVLQPEVR